MGQRIREGRRIASIEFVSGECHRNRNKRVQGSIVHHLVDSVDAHFHVVAPICNCRLPLIDGDEDSITSRI
jgi:hypothetical protein